MYIFTVFTSTQVFTLLKLLSFLFYIFMKIMKCINLSAGDCTIRAKLQDEIVLEIRNAPEDRVKMRQATFIFCWSNQINSFLLIKLDYLQVERNAMALIGSFSIIAAVLNAATHSWNHNIFENKLWLQSNFLWSLNETRSYHWFLTISLK